MYKFVIYKFDFVYILFQRTQEEWLSVFYIAATIYLAGCATYLMLGSAELEPWAKIEKRKKSLPEILNDSHILT